MMKSVTTRLRRALAGLAVAACSLPAAAQVDTRIDGLPAGLSLRVDLVNEYCDGPGTGRLASRVLTEQTVVFWDSVQQLDGSWRLVQRTRTAYVAQFASPTLPACGGEDVTSFKLVVLGEAPDSRTVTLAGYRPGMTALHVTMEAKTTALIGVVNLQPVELTAVTRGTMQQWQARYGDNMGGPIVEPTLDFLRPGNSPFPGALTSVARLSITRDGAVCLRTAGTTACRTQAQGGTLVLGSVSVDVSRTSHGGSRTTWRFQLASTFPAGTMTVRAGANDLDTIDYLVDAQPAALDLLPWKPLSLPVLVN